MASNSDPRKKKKPSPSSPSLFPVELSSNSLPSSKADFIRLVAVVSIAAAVAVACNFIATSLNQPPKPFCDTIISGSEDSLSRQDDCEPCPANGLCYDDKLECGSGYSKHGKLCVEDGDINEAAKKLSKWVEVHICEAYAQFLCSGTGKCWVQEDELWSKLNESIIMDKDKMGEAVYMPAKQRAMDIIHKILETRRDNNGIEEFKCSELLVNHYKPLSCRVRQWIIKHALLLVPACALFMGSILIASRAYWRQLLSVRAEEIYNEVCDILEEKPLISRNASDGSEPPWVVASWLRDHLLSPKERKDAILWKKVEELVQEDSRVDQYPKLVKGESKVVWEWQVEGSLSSSGKRKKSKESTPKLKDSISSSSNAQYRMPACEPSI